MGLQSPNFQIQNTPRILATTRLTSMVDLRGRKGRAGGAPEAPPSGCRGPSGAVEGGGGEEAPLPGNTPWRPVRLSSLASTLLSA